MTSPRISGILFDIGGVLVALDGVPYLSRALQLEESHEGMHKRWLACPSVVVHETGRMSVEAFAAASVADLRAAASPTHHRTDNDFGRAAAIIVGSHVDTAPGSTTSRQRGRVVACPTGQVQENRVTSSAEQLVEPTGDQRVRPSRWVVGAADPVGRTCPSIGEPARGTRLPEGQSASARVERRSDRVLREAGL